MPGIHDLLHEYGNDDDLVQAHLEAFLRRKIGQNEEDSEERFERRLLDAVRKFWNLWRWWQWDFTCNTPELRFFAESPETFSYSVGFKLHALVNQLGQDRAYKPAVMIELNRKFQAKQNGDPAKRQSYFVSTTDISEIKEHLVGLYEKNLLQKDLPLPSDDLHCSTDTGRPQKTSSSVSRKSSGRGAAPTGPARRMGPSLAEDDDAIILHRSTQPDLIPNDQQPQDELMDHDVERYSNDDNGFNGDDSDHEDRNDDHEDHANNGIMAMLSWKKALEKREEAVARRIREADALIASAVRLNDQATLKENAAIRARNNTRDEAATIAKKEALMVDREALLVRKEGLLTQKEIDLQNEKKILSAEREAFNSSATVLPGDEQQYSEQQRQQYSEQKTLLTTQEQPNLTQKPAELEQRKADLEQREASVVARKQAISKSVVPQKRRHSPEAEAETSIPKLHANLSQSQAQPHQNPATAPVNPSLASGISSCPIPNKNTTPATITPMARRTDPTMQAPSGPKRKGAVKSAPGGGLIETIDPSPLSSSTAAATTRTRDPRLYGASSYGPSSSQRTLESTSRPSSSQSNYADGYDRLHERGRDGRGKRDEKMERGDSGVRGQQTARRGRR